MKRLLIALVLFLLLPIRVEGATQQDYHDYLQSWDLSFFEETLNEDTYDLLRELNIDDFDLESISGLSFDEVLRLLQRFVKSGVKAPLEAMLAVLVYVILSSLFQSIKENGGEMSDLYAAVTALVIASVLMIKISPTVGLAASGIGITADFIYAFVPVFCAIVAAGGGVGASFSSNAMLLMLSQGLSFLSANVLMPVINCFLAIGICSSLRPQIGLSRLTASLKKILTSAMAFLSGVFVSVLSLKTTVAARADVLGMRSMRFMINSAVPVVGGALSEGLTAIQTYSSLIKGSVGTVGMIAAALVLLPSVIEVLLWRGVLALSQLICDVFGDNAVSQMLGVFKDAMLLIYVVLIMAMLTTVVSVGVLIAARTA